MGFQWVQKCESIFLGILLFIFMMKTSPFLEGWEAVMWTGSVQLEKIIEVPLPKAIIPGLQYSSCSIEDFLLG